MPGKNVIVTGASSGIGRACARLLAGAGHRVFLVARRADRLQELAAEISAAGGAAEACTADVTDGARLAAIAVEIAGRHGHIDVLVNNAGIMALDYVESLDLAAAHHSIDVNLKGIINGVHAVLPHMIRQNSGHILNVSSVGAEKILPAMSVYSATKAAVRTFTEGLRQEMAAKYNIRVSEVVPGAVATEMAGDETDPAILEQFRRFKDVRFLDPEDIARAVVFAVEQPDHVSVNRVQVRPTNQEL